MKKIIWTIKFQPVVGLLWSVLTLASCSRSNMRTTASISPIKKDSLKGSPVLLRVWLGFVRVITQCISVNVAGFCSIFNLFFIADAVYKLLWLLWSIFNVKFFVGGESFKWAEGKYCCSLQDLYAQDHCLQKHSCLISCYMGTIAVRFMICADVWDCVCICRWWRSILGL